MIYLYYSVIKLSKIIIITIIMTTMAAVTTTTTVIITDGKVNPIVIGYTRSRLAAAKCANTHTSLPYKVSNYSYNNCWVSESHWESKFAFMY